MPYTTLDPDKIIKTADILESRVEERFPNASLVGVASEVKAIAIDAKARAEKLSQPLAVFSWALWFSSSSVRF